MSDLVAEIKAKIRSLSAEERADLIRALFGELDGPSDTVVDNVWVEEARRRQCELASGTVKSIPGQQVFANLRERLKR
ncbi:MAG: hypothetical protein AMXMBFR59_42190 [Rhodanobacteraceae bacterium]